MSQKINCIIIEDELPASRLLEMHIGQLNVLTLSGKFESVQAAMPIIVAGNIDLIFLDINLPGKSGIEFAREIPPNVSIIFTTAYPEFRLTAVDYLLKPISFDRFAKAIQKILKLRNAYPDLPLATNKVSFEPFIYLKSDRMSIKVLVNNILYVEAKGNFLIVYSNSNSIKTYLSILELMERLPEGLFCRIHRSFLVALSKVISYNSQSVNVANTELPIGRVYRDTVRKVIG